MVVSKRMHYVLACIDSTLQADYYRDARLNANWWANCKRNLYTRQYSSNCYRSNSKLLKEKNEIYQLCFYHYHHYQKVAIG